MTHHMKLNPSPYAAIKSGRKNIELRLNDEKRQKIQVGDEIIFTNTQISDLKLHTKVIALHKEPSFYNSRKRSKPRYNDSDLFVF